MLMEKRIHEKLTATFEPVYLQIENESYMHSSGRGAESHFKVVLVSNAFEGKRSVARHQAVYQTLAEELVQGVHALALHTYTPREWEANAENVPKSPACVGVGL